MSSKKEHDTYATRVVQMLMMFNEGKRISVEELAEEFCVSERSIQRDLKRFSFLPLEKKGGYYSLADYCLGKFNTEDIHQFATFSGIRELYPELNDTFIKSILNVKMNKGIDVKGLKYENLSHKVDNFNNIAAAIVMKLCITFSYSDTVREVHPYKLINTNGIWYLVGVDKGTLKNFSFSKIQMLEVLQQSFKEDADIIKTLKEHKGMWVTQNHIEVVLEVDASVSEYFLRRDLLPHQKVLEHTAEGLVVSTQVAYEEEILKVVRYWIPHITITSPAYLQEKLEKTLKDYLKL